MKRFLLILICAGCPALAVPVVDRAAFLALVEGRTLNLPLLDTVLRLQADGRMSGSALGWTVTGTWDWREDRFCRQMDWGGLAIDAECQTVDSDGSSVRFTSVSGRAARFWID